MCGIYGAAGLALTREQALRALRTLAHRGPDGEGLQHDREHDVLLGHRRLAILDLSEGGAQPMRSEDGRVWLVLNGEIYNHVALRAELVARGHRFAGHSDAEVVLHLYEELGAQLLARLTGMFALAIWDAARGELLLARDRLGIKPLYYATQGERLVFASELAALCASPGLELTPDASAYWDFLTYQCVPAPKTIYREARKLPAGHLARWRAGRLRVERWWDVRYEPDDSLDERAAVEAVGALLPTVVREHLQADVPLGLFLSGGVDSTLVAAQMRGAAAAGATRAFSVRFREGGVDESERARASAAALGFDWCPIEFGGEQLLASAAQLPAVFHEPFGDASALAMLGLCAAAARERKVVLSGDGGDETHLGYGRYFKERRRRRLHALTDALPGPALIRSTPLAHSVLRHALEGPWGRMAHFYGGIPAATKRRLLDAGGEFADYDDYWLLREHDRPDLPPFARQQYRDLHGSLPELLLAKVDRCAMRAGLELRPPLLDHRLVELAARIPERVLARTGSVKWILRELLARALPGDAREYHKKGFSVPIRHHVEQRGELRLSRDLDVLGAFRVSRRKAERLLRPGRDAHAYWLLHALQTNLAARAG